jgi:hypothetical protein
MTMLVASSILQVLISRELVCGGLQVLNLRDLNFRVQETETACQCIRNKGIRQFVRSRRRNFFREIPRSSLSLGTTILVGSSFFGENRQGHNADSFMRQPPGSSRELSPQILPGRAQNSAGAWLRLHPGQAPRIRLCYPRKAPPF